MTIPYTTRWLRATVLALSLLLVTSTAFAQGCAMCKNNAAATDAQSQRALNRAILVMVLPPVGLMLAGAALARRYARRRDRATKP